MTIIDARSSSSNGKAKERIPWNARDEGNGWELGNCVESGHGFDRLLRRVSLLRRAGQHCLLFCQRVSSRSEATPTLH
jgi:hypothetical protein